jgi:DNA-binding transcriptional LysR family regulator
MSNTCSAYSDIVFGMPVADTPSAVNAPRDPPSLAGRVRLRQLLLMRTIADVGNLRGAAAALQMTQPAATRLLKELEHRVGSVLFERSARGMTPTTEGRVVLARATRVLNDVDAIAEDLHHHRLGHGARTRLGVIGSFAGVLLPRALARLKQESPTTTVEIVEGAQEALIQALRSGSLDLVLGRALSESHAQDVMAELLFEERFSIVTGVSVEGRKRRFTLEKLVDEPWILPPRGVPVRVRIDSAFLAAAGRTPVDVIESASLLVNQQILHNERRFALMPDHAAAHFARRGLIARVACQLPEILGPLTLFTLHDAEPLPAAVRLFESLRYVAREAAAGETRPLAVD